MDNSEFSPHLGQFVLITSGRDADQYAIIVRLIDERFVFVADGERKKFDRPKKKNLQHLKLIDYVSPEVQSSLLDTGRVTNGKLRFAMNKYMVDIAVKEKGDEFDGER